HISIGLPPRPGSSTVTPASGSGRNSASCAGAIGFEMSIACSPPAYHETSATFVVVVALCAVNATIGASAVQLASFSTSLYSPSSRGCVVSLASTSRACPHGQPAPNGAG